jgi:hypothetical protein
MNPYLDLAKQGKTEWRRYVLEIILILFMWQVLSAIPSNLYKILVLGDGNLQTSVSFISQFIGVDLILGSSLLMLTSLPFLIGLFLAICFIHGTMNL